MFTGPVEPDHGNLHGERWRETWFHMTACSGPDNTFLTQHICAEHKLIGGKQPGRL